MKIVTISDTHGKHKDLDLSEYLDCDTIIHAGDWTAGCDNSVQKSIDFLLWFNTLPFKNKILIAGNHEVAVERDPEGFNELLCMFSDIIYLNNSTITIKGINFYGSPYSNNFHNWAFMLEEEDLELIWNDIPNNTNVLITHGPAYYTHDKVVRGYGRDPHVGSKTLQNRKLELPNLKVHINGHIHEDYGQSTINKILNICPSVLDERYKLVNKPITFTV